MPELPKGPSALERETRDRPMIRSMSLTDVALAAALHGGCFEDDPWHAGAFADLLLIPGTFGFFAVTAEEPLGILLCRVVADECEVLTFGVVGSARRRGVGRELLQAGLRKAAELKARTVFLEVAFDNEAAIGLYNAMGFSQTAVRRDYYRRTESPRRVDAVIMSRPLDSKPFPRFKDGMR